MAPNQEILRDIHLFATMDDDELAALSAVMDEASFAAGQVICRAGEAGGTMHILRDGEVEVSLQDDDGETMVLDNLHAGDFFGELSLLDGGPRSATVTATQPTTTVVLGRQDLLALLRQKPHMAQDFIAALVKIVRHSDTLLRGRVSRNPNEVLEEHETLGARVADAVARFGGSWTFIFSFGAVLTVWVIVNTIFLLKDAFDPYPFILLNLVLSMLAALQAPVIMMSQNRQDAKDRIRSELDYRVNLKAEVGVAELLRKVDAIEERLASIESGL